MWTSPGRQEFLAKMKLLYWLAPVSATISLDFVVYRGNSIDDKGIDRTPLMRRDDFEMTLENERTFYIAQLEIGSSKQKVDVLVDTGSSDLWVPAGNCTGELYSYKKRDMEKKRVVDPNDFEKRKRPADKRRVLDRLGVEGIELQQKNPKNVKAEPEKVEVIVNMVPIPTATKNVNVDGVDRATTYYYSYSYIDYYTWVDYSYSDGTTYYYTRTFSDYSQYASAYSSYYSSYSAYYSSYYATRTADYSDVSACTAYGTYATGKSDSSKLNETLGVFYISYADGSFAYGDYVSDDVTIGDETVKGLNFAVAYYTDSESGVLGLGLPALESSYYLGSGETSYSHQYENLPMLLKSQGIIKKELYSVWLGKNNASEGSILFGAVDTSKYTGDLTRVKILNRYEKIGEKNPVYLEIALDSVAGTNLAVNYRTSVLLDTGATLCHLPSAYVSKIGSHLGGTESSYGYWTVSCDYLDSDEDLVFDFSGAKITVPLKDMVVQSASGSYCYLGIVEDDETPSLGDVFLRSAYVVFDLEDYEIALAQASDGTGDSNIEEVTSSIPNAVTAENYDFTSISLQWTETSYGTSAYFTLFTESFDDIVSSATPLSTNDNWSLESASSYIYSGTSGSTSRRTTSSRTSVAGQSTSTGGTTTSTSSASSGARSSTTSTSSRSSGSSSTVAGGDSSKPDSQGPLFLLLAVLTVLSLV